MKIQQKLRKDFITEEFEKLLIRRFISHWNSGYRFFIEKLPTINLGRSVVHSILFIMLVFFFRILFWIY